MEPHAAKLRELQWGLRLSTEEGKIGVPRKIGHANSFNGASVFQRRKADAYVPNVTYIEWLQWGLRLSTEEGSNHPKHEGSVMELQWGLRLSTEEGIPERKNCTVGVQLQWGLRLSTEEGSLLFSISKLFKSFNGASVFQRRKVFIRQII
jgi:hypothetical protein